MSEWLPIGSAPKNGDNFLAYMPCGASTVAWWGYLSFQSQSEGIETYAGFMDRLSEERDHFLSPEPTHWMPLPAAPSEPTK